MIGNESAQYKSPLWTQAANKAYLLVGTLPVMVAILTFVARAIYLGRSFDIFIDEVTYLQIARSVGFRLQLQLAGQPFFLHPPAWFLIEGAYLRVFNVSGNLIAQIYATRFLVAAFAALSAALVFLIARRAAGWPAGLIAALLFALDPFIIKLNSLNILETSAVAWTLAGYWTLISGIASAEDAQASFAWRRLLVGPFAQPAQGIAFWRAGVAGLFFGLALLTKEMTVFITLLPLAIFFVWRWPMPRRALAIIGGVAVATYAIYPLAVAIQGRWASYVEQKTHGFVRFAGLIRTTGFKRTGGPSLTQTILDRLSHYGTTYLMIALGLLAIYLLLRHGDRIGRLVAVWALCTYAMLGYNVLFGTLEEQFFYYLVIVCSLVNAIALVCFLGSAAGRRVGRPMLYAATVALALMTTYNGYQWADVHLHPNDGFASVLAYLQQRVPRGQGVASTNETGQSVLQGYLSGPWGAWTSVDDLKRFAPSYVLVTPHTLVWNNSSAARVLLTWIEQNGHEVYVFNGSEDNVLRLYSLPKNSATATNTASAIP
jgi:4-amino-4-deoxy-L-arabinose transferase-like glycosyltransferase